MSIFNRRYAILGWLTWLGVKTYMKGKVRQAVPGTVGGTKRPNKGAIVAAVAAVAGLLLLWRRGRGGGESAPADS